jgi:hypothetical protein
MREITEKMTFCFMDNNFLENSSVFHPISHNMDAKKIKTRNCVITTCQIYAVRTNL